MKENNKFEDLKTKLLNEVLQWNDNSKITEGFKKKFFKLLELCTFSMMQDKDNFFAFFTIQMKREIRLDLPTAVGNTASLTHFNIYFNPFIFLECSLEEMKALIKHEVYHIMYNHLKRARSIIGKYSSTAISKAMDVSINQYIDKLPAWSHNLRNVSLSYNINLKDDESMEWYAEEIQQGIDRLNSGKSEKIIEDKVNQNSKLIKRKHDSVHAHDLWWNSEDDLNFEQLREITKRAVNNANKGKIPIELQQIISDLNKMPEISWKDYLRKIIGTLPSGHKKITTRKDRRQPYRLELRGKLNNHIVQIIIAIDISGSISNEEIDQIMTEVFHIVKNHPSEIIIIECDNKIRRVYKVRSKENIRKKLDTKGGTLYSPVFEYIHNHRMRNHLLIYFTDGVGEEELKYAPINYKTLWVITGKGEKLSLKDSYGEVKRLSNIKVEKADPTYAKDTMKELLMEWQK
jgi:predicted metal-dependent peptidase